MKDEYYTGPGGVFYNPIIDEIILLIKNAEGILDNNYKEKAALYDAELIDRKYKRTLIEKPNHLVRLSDF